jgi:hypothetical protein
MSPENLAALVESRSLLVEGKQCDIKIRLVIDDDSEEDIDNLKSTVEEIDRILEEIEEGDGYDEENDDFEDDDDIEDDDIEDDDEYDDIEDDDED